MALRYHVFFTASLTKTVCFDKIYGSILRHITNTITTHSLLTH